MPDVLGSPPSPRAAVFWNGNEWQWALVDAAGHLQVDVVDAAGLQDALQSVATDRLIVRGEDQLFSYGAQYWERVIVIPPGAGNTEVLGTVVPAGIVRVLTSAVSMNDTGISVASSVGVRKGVIRLDLAGGPGMVQWQRIAWSGVHPMIQDDRPYGWFRGHGGGDVLYAFFGGYDMTLET